MISKQINVDVRKSLSQVRLLAKVKHFLSFNDLQKVDLFLYWIYLDIFFIQTDYSSFRILLPEGNTKALTRVHKSTHTLLLFLTPFTGYRSTAEVISKPSY